MAAEDETDRALAKMRIRGAPATMVGAGPLVSDVAIEGTLLPAIRVLTTTVGEETRLTYDGLGPAIDRLEAHLGSLRARRDGPTFVLLKSDPFEDEPHKRDYDVGIPIRGESKASEDGTILSGRLLDSFHVHARVSCPVADLEDIWTFLFGRFLLQKAHRLSRPAIRIDLLTDPRSTKDREMQYEIFVPVSPAIPRERPVRELKDRETLG